MKTNWKKLCGALVCSSVLLAPSAFAQTYDSGSEMTEPAGADRAMDWSWLGLLGLLGLMGLKKPARHENEYRAPRTA